MIRMEVACFFVIAFMSIMYFSTKRERTKLHRTFSILLIMSMLHLVFDGLTIYTVNHLYSVPILINDIVHRLFMGTMIIVFYLVNRYIALLIENDSEQRLPSSGFFTVILIIGLVCIMFLPIIYIETEQGNYSYGPIAYMLYVCLAIYIFQMFLNLLRNWSKLHEKKKMAIGLALVIQFVALLYQAIYPLALISGMGIMLANLSFYLTIENPDIFLVEQVQKEKRKADEANAAKSSFLSHMSHEIRTPMNAIVGMSEIMLRTEMTEEQREYLNNIRSSGNALVSIINDILDISKIEAGKMKLVEDEYDMRQTLRDIHMIILNRIEDKPVELIFDIDEAIPHRLYGDAIRIRQVFINLLNNAVKFTDKGYVKLTLKTEVIAEEEILLHVSVADTGQGIQEEDLQRLFSAFEQVDNKQNRGKEGTGLGLSISSELIGMMGGKLQVKSEYGVGSEFFFTILQKIVFGEAEAEEDTDSDAMNFIAPDARILIVDDNEMNRKVAVGLLAPLQMQMDTADDGAKALAMIQQNTYHLVFMDHMMPGMDGVETTKRLREMQEAYYQEVPVIALTANAMKEAEKLFYEAGMNGFVAKPIDMRQMCTVIRKWLPESLLIKQENSIISGNASLDANRGEIPELEAIDTKEGIKNSGGMELFVSLLGDFYRLIDLRSAKIEEYLADRRIKDYTIEVHALKSTSRMIGAMELSECFWHLEQLGNAEDIDGIMKETPEVLALYRSYKPILEPYGKLVTAKREATIEEIIMYLQGLQEAAEAFDLDVADAAMEQLEECLLPENCQNLMESLRVHITNVALEKVLEVAEEMLTILKSNYSL